MRGRTALAVAAVLIVLATTPDARAAVPVLVIEGRGFGHGVGLAQDGAYWMGRDGASTPQILGQFYPGVDIGRGSGQVRVAVLTTKDAETLLTFPGGGEVRSPRTGAQAPGFPVVLGPGDAVRVRHDGSYRVAPIEGDAPAARARIVRAQLPLPTTSSSILAPPTTQAPPAPPTSAPPPSPTAPPPTSPATAPPPAERSTPTPVWAVPSGDGTVGVPERSAVYRGVVEATVASGPLRLVNEVDVEHYLRGMGEVRDPGWPAASLRAQAVVARTYALRAMAANGEICDTQRCQVYLGQQVEYGAMDRAVAATAGQVLTYRGRFASAVYSANGAGVSATPSEGFGTPDAPYPYLRAAPYPTQSPDTWEVRIALGDLAPRLRYTGALHTVAVSATGASGRATAIELDGDAGPTTRTPFELARAAGLRSTMWRLRVELGDAPAPPPEAGLVVQVLPEEAAPESARPSRARRSSEATRPRTAEEGGRSPAAPGVALALVAVVVGAGLAGGWTLRREGQRPDREPSSSRRPS